MRIAAALPAVLALLAGCRPPTPRAATEPASLAAAPFRTGLDVLQATGLADLRGKRVGVVTNHTGLDRSLRSLPEIVGAADGVTLAAVFGPEHGVTGAVAAGDGVKGGVDPRLGVPVHSLYGEVRRPTREMLAGIDVLLYDMQDAGSRAYTYLSTLKEVLAAAGESRVEVWVLDRPSPCGVDAYEGPVLEPGRESFVGCHAVPLRPGLTVGEFARMVNEESALGASLRVIAMEGYRRDMHLESTGLVWIAPSPNIPTVDTALVYAGTVLIEGTNLSEGRGTTRPFQLIGAPWLDGRRIVETLGAAGLPGCALRAATFTPWDSKHEGKECGGVEVHVTDRRALRPVALVTALLLAVVRTHPDQFQFKKETFDRLAGTSKMREAIEKGAPLEEIVESWRPGLEEYAARRGKYLLY